MVNKREVVHEIDTTVITLYLSYKFISSSQDAKRQIGWYRTHHP